MATVVDLVGKNNVPVKLATTQIAERRNAKGYRICNAYNFPSDKIVLMNAIFYDYYDQHHITCLVKSEDGLFRQVSSYVPKDFVMTPLEGEEKESFLADIRKWQYSDGLTETLAHNCTLGADPEIFVVDEDQNLIPAASFLGSKKSPSITATDSVHGKQTCYWDGFQAEFTTYPGITCLGYVVDSIFCGLKGVLQHARKKFPKAKLSLCTVMQIPPDMMEAASEEVVEFGCMPSYNAYGITVDLPPGREVPFRSVGGHIHLGIKKITHEQAIPIVQAMDAIIGVASVALFAGIDDPMRRQYYGLPGEYRLPDHGLEYRPLSAAWMAHPVITNLVFDITRKAMMVGKGGHLKYMWNATQEEVISCMRESNVPLAKEILSRNEAMMLRIINAAYPKIPHNSDGAKTIFNIFYNGMSSVLRDPYDIEGNWNMFNGKYIMHGEINVNANFKKLVENPTMKI